MTRRLAWVVVLASTVATLAGCASWRPGWADVGKPAPPGDIAPLVAKASALLGEADDRGKLAEVIQLYEIALERSPDDYEVLTELCQGRILDAASYAKTGREKEQGYRAGIRYCERALYTNPEFRALVDRNIPIDQAARTLTRRESAAMMFWVTGVSYYFKECLGGLGRLTGYRLIRKVQPILTRMMEVDPDYSHGVVHFSMGIYYLGLPKFAGGDRVKSAELLARAQAVGPRSLLVRWGRAKYYDVETRNRAAFERDLRWVLEQDPRLASTPYAWNVYFQRDAARLLAQVDRLF